MHNTKREQQLKREKLLLRYSIALEHGDFEIVAEVLAAAEEDPVLERMILELNEELQQVATATQNANHNNNNHNHRGHTTMTVITGSPPKVIGHRRQTRLSGVAAAVAAIFVMLFAAYFIFQNSENGGTPAGAPQGADTETPNMTGTIEGRQQATLNANQQTVAAWQIQATESVEAVATQDRIQRNEWNATVATVTAAAFQGTFLPTSTPPSFELNQLQQTATAFWIQMTLDAEQGTFLPTTTPPSFELNPNQQTATAFWIQATQDHIATVGTPTPLPTFEPTAIPPLVVDPFQGRLDYPNFEEIFYGIDGTFVLYNPQDDVSVVYNPDRAMRRYPPHSTFKILNAAISLETESMPDEDFIIEWDQAQYPLTEYPNGSPFDEWRQDQNLRTGMQYSVLWFYTEVARLIGEESMTEWVEAVGYGNMDTSAWLDDVQFWLGSSLEISAMEQVNFLWRFYSEQLGFSERTTNIVKDIIMLEETETYRLSAKTGTGSNGLGWLVGYLERGDDVYVFALNLDASGDVRFNVLRQILTDMGLMN